jgi:hypothetical protein
LALVRAGAGAGESENEIAQLVHSKLQQVHVHGREQRCQMIFFKSVRSDVKNRQNPPSRIGKIRQKSAKNWDDFRPFFTLRVVFVAFFSADFALSQKWPRGKISLI